MKLGSLFDGIGGFPLAWTMLGGTPVWASEIEAFPMTVTAARFPNMKQLGDVTKINGAEIEPVDVITFGSPCQDLLGDGMKKGNKFNAQPCRAYGREFDSKAEADRYGELLLLQRAGEIRQLECQVPYELIPAQYEIVPRYGKQGKRLKDGKRCIEKSVVYYADFQYINKDGEKIVEDVKGFRESNAYSLFVIKRKLMLQRYGIRVQEITKTKRKTKR